MATVKSTGVMRVYPRSSKIGRGKTCVDLFSGAGGLAVGFRQAGWSILAANDADVDAGATFRLNFPEAVFFEGPISELTSEALLSACGLAAGELDCLIGGPPCQSFSYNNHQRSAEDQRAGLFRDYLRLVAELKPKSLVMENVPGILTIGDRQVMEEIDESLSSLGYKVAVRVLDADQFGTPQTRRRVFIVASRIGDPNELLPQSTHLPAKLKNRRVDENAVGLNTVTVGDAIGDLPVLRNGGGKQIAPRGKRGTKSAYQRELSSGAKLLYNHICHHLTPAMLQRIKFVPEGGNWRDIPRRLLPAGMKRARKSDHTKRYGRLRRNAQASTLLTKCDPHWGAYVHPTQHRTISVREAARLQGFPDVFRFAGNGTTKQYAQVGNAVPVPVARALAIAVGAHLAKAKRRVARSSNSRAKPQSIKRPRGKVMVREASPTRTRAQPVRRSPG